MKSLSLLSSFVGYDASAWSVMFPGIGKKGTRFSRHWKHDVRVGVQILYAVLNTTNGQENNTGEQGNSKE